MVFSRAILDLVFAATRLNITKIGFYFLEHNIQNLYQGKGEYQRNTYVYLLSFSIKIVPN